MKNIALGQNPRGFMLNAAVADDGSVCLYHVVSGHRMEVHLSAEQLAALHEQA